MSWSRCSTIPLVVVCVVGCHAQPRRESTAERVALVAGCYRLTSLAGISAADTNAVLGSLRTFRLHSEPASEQRPMFHRVTGLPSTAYDTLGMRLSLWVADTSSDTLRISVSNGFAGIGLSVVRTSDLGLRGRVINFWDAGPPFYRELGEVVARRTPCSDTVGIVAPAG